MTNQKQTITPKSKEALQQDLMNLILALELSKYNIIHDPDVNDNLYYNFAEMYRALDQFADENDIDICDLDRCFDSAKEHTAKVKAEPKTAEELYAQLKGEKPPFNKDAVVDDVLNIIRNRKTDI